jgi:uncharacterized cupredoxin-like copper-binding protein
MSRRRIGVAAVAVVAAALVWVLPIGAVRQAQHVTADPVAAGKPSEFHFKLAKLKVPKGKVTFKVTNLGTIPHDFKIAGKKTRELAAGQSQTITVTFLKAGKYKFLCTLPSHAEAGMKGVLTVT